MFGQQSAGLDALLHRPQPSAWQQFCRAPCVFLANLIYNFHNSNLATQIQPPIDPISVVCISDTHNTQPKLPESDILVHAGDLTQSGTLAELEAALSWLRGQPHPHKIVIAGNHDVLLDKTYSPSDKAAAQRSRLDWGSGSVIYLEDADTVITCNNGRRLRIYGSPKSARHGNWAFQYPRLTDVWANSVPNDVDILVTHGPSRCHLDLLNLGCVHLIRELWRVKPKLHVFGHVHEGYGQEWLRFDGLQRAYEGVIVAAGGLFNLMQAVQAYAGTLFGCETVEARTLVVNAAMVGGLRDDERRRPFKVVI